MVRKGTPKAFETFTVEDVLRGNRWRGQEVPAEFLLSLKEEAATLKQSQLWKVLKAELKWFAVSSLLLEGKDGEDIRFARIFGNVVDVIDAKLNDLAK